jgi:hypothetical protein
MKAHHDRSICECVIALAEEGRSSASTAGEQYGVPKSTARARLQKFGRSRQVGKRRGTGLWRVSSPAQDAALVAEAQRNPFVSARDLEAATAFPGHKPHLFRDLRKQVSGHAQKNAKQIFSILIFGGPTCCIVCRNIPLEYSNNCWLN